MFRSPWYISSLGVFLTLGALSVSRGATGDAPTATLMPNAVSTANAPITTVLPNGLRIICRQETDTPLVAINVFVRVGALQETADNAGISSFVARTLLASTTTNTPEWMDSEIETLGGNVGVTRQPDWTQINALVVKDQFSSAALLVTSALKNADFDKNAIEEARQQILDQIDNTDTDLFETTYHGLRQRLYGESTYGLSALGSSQSIKGISRGALLKFYNRYYVPSNFVIVVVGNIAPDEATRVITQDLDDFPTFNRGSHWRDPMPTPHALPTRDFAPIHATLLDQSQSCIMVGYQAPPMSSPDYPVLVVANALLGGMKSSRMFTSMREKQGLAYDLGSFYNALIGTGEMVGYVFAAPSPDTKKADAGTGLIRDSIIKQFESLKTTPPTAKELARAQHFVIGSYKIKHERLETRTSLLGIADISTKDGVALDQNYATLIGQVTVADIQRVAEKYFVHPVVSVVEPDTKDNIGVKEE